MRVPIRKGDEYTHLKPDPHMTQAKYDELKAKLDRLQNVTRFRWMKETAVNAEGGDFSENAGYQAAKAKLRGINEAILQIQEHLKRAIIIEARDASDGVQLGSRVAVRLDGVVKIYTILGSSEIDLANNIISHNSPLGAAFLGRRVGEKFNIKPGSKTMECEILEIV